MVDELKGYPSGHFFFRPEDHLLQVCNAPTDKAGVYLVYALVHGSVELVYIGRSGKKGKDGRIQVRIAGCGGIKDRIVNGKHFNRVARRKAWPLQMLLERMEALDVYWYVTHDEKEGDCPLAVEKLLLDRYFAASGRPPRWNRK